jgi:hypothetical protein
MLSFSLAFTLEASVVLTVALIFFPKVADNLESSFAKAF